MIFIIVFKAEGGNPPVMNSYASIYKKQLYGEMEELKKMVSFIYVVETDSANGQECKEEEQQCFSQCNVDEVNSELDNIKYRLSKSRVKDIRYCSVIRWLRY